jgi:hypothetical protein
MKQLLDVFGMMLIGDGLLSVLHPRRHCLLWDVGPEPCRKLIGEFAEHTPLTRAAGALELVVGVWLASRQEVH